MKKFSRGLLVAAFGLIVAAALSEAMHCTSLAILFAGLSGGAFSALFSLVMGRMSVIQQTLFEVLADVKNTNPLTPTLGTKIQIKREILTDMGISEQSDLIQHGLAPAIDACKAGENHNAAASKLYPKLKASVFGAAAQSLFSPQYPR